MTTFHLPPCSLPADAYTSSLSRFTSIIPTDKGQGPEHILTPRSIMPQTSKPIQIGDAFQRNVIVSFHFDANEVLLQNIKTQIKTNSCNNFKMEIKQESGHTQFHIMSALFRANEVQNGSSLWCKGQTVRRMSYKATERAGTVFEIRASQSGLGANARQLGCGAVSFGSFRMVRRVVVPLHSGSTSARNVTVREVSVLHPSNHTTSHTRRPESSVCTLTKFKHAFKTHYTFHNNIKVYYSYQI